MILTVYDDFATSEASVTHGSTNDEITTGVNVKFGVSVQIFGGNDRFDDFFEDILAKSGQCDLQKIAKYELKVPKLSKYIRINVKFSVSVQIFGGNDRFDNFFEDILTKSGQCDLGKLFD